MKIRKIPETNFRSNRFLQILLLLYSAIWIWAAIEPVSRFDWFLENLLTFVVMFLLCATYRRFPLSDFSYFLIFIFMSMHAVGGHYTYSEVPFGFWLKEFFDFSRNHYDRIVHFCFGLLLAYPVYELIYRTVTKNIIFVSVIAYALISTSSGIFEIIEWIVAEIVSPEAGSTYLGTQGDEFDSQKDMFLASAGAIITLCLLYLSNLKFSEAEGH